MTYNGRAVMEQVAAEHGWALGSMPAAYGLEQVTYTRSGDQVLIVWTPDNTATTIVRNFCRDDELVAVTGPLGLITARGWLEAAVG